MTVIGLPMIINYSLYNFIIFGISWIIIWAIWVYLAFIAAYYFPGYYFITCYYLKLRLTSIAKRMKNLVNSSNHLSFKGRQLTIRRLLEDHNKLCQQIDNYNKFWRKYITITYSIYVTLVCFIIYTVFYSSIKWFFRLEYCIVLSAHLLLITIITYSGSSVSQFSHILFRDLSSIYAKNHFPIEIQLKVSFEYEVSDDSK